VKKKSIPTCTNCNIFNCGRLEKKFPDFCLSVKYREDSFRVLKIYQEDKENAKIARAAGEIEGVYYGKLTRVEEIIELFKKIGAKKIGVATCLGLINEAKIFAHILEVKGFEAYSVICKVGAIDKTVINIPPELKLQKDCHESICNPILQAEILNKQGTDYNVIVGLCVGHDSLFTKYSQAPVTTLITKDRVLGHNPAAALYTSNFFYKRLLAKE